MNKVMLMLHAVVRSVSIGFTVLVAVVGVIAVSGIIDTPVYAVDDTPSAENCDPEGKNSGNFLNFPTWYRGLACDSSGKLSLKSSSIGMIIMTVGLNVIDMMLRLIAMITIVFLIWGGIQYMMSRGEPAKSAIAQKTITGAIVGLIIAIVSVSIVTFIVKGISAK